MTTEAEALRDAFERFLQDYRTEGCAAPDCTVCQRSKQALDDFRTLLSRRPSPAGDDVERAARAIYEASEDDPPSFEWSECPDEWKDEHRALARAALAAAPGRGVPEGWRLVPETMTERMDLRVRHEMPWLAGANCEQFWRIALENAPTPTPSMLSTAPPPPVPAEGGVAPKARWADITGEAEGRRVRSAAECHPSHLWRKGLGCTVCGYRTSGNLSLPCRGHLYSQEQP